MSNIYKKIFNNSPIIQIITDESNNILCVNKKFCNYFGFDAPEVEGKHISTLLAVPEEAQTISTHDTEYPNVWEVTIKNGGRRFVAIETTNFDSRHLITAYDLTKEAFRARNNSINVNELKKYLINTEPYD